MNLSEADYDARALPELHRLVEALDSPATYRFRGSEGYVRARVLESNGRIAWLQPVMVAATR